MSTAATDRWRLPAEWESQAGVMLTWPHPETAWADDLIAVEAVYQRLALEIARREKLLLVCDSPATARSVAERLRAAGVESGRLCLAVAASNDTWARDHGPLTLVDDRGGARLLDFRFNGWGGKFPAEDDDRINRQVHEQGVFAATDLESVPVVLEGGALETDGRGTLLATGHSVLTATRNPGFSRNDVESLLADTLAVRRIHWLQHGALSGDDTDGHIDTLVRFADPETLLHVTAEAGDPDYAELQAMRQELERLRTADGRPYRLIALPPADPLYDADGRRLPATYANFLVINGAVLVPIYAGEQDRRALETVERAFPDREVIGIDCRPIVRQNGSLHCLTMQFPAALALRSALP